MMAAESSPSAVSMLALSLLCPYLVYILLDSSSLDMSTFCYGLLLSLLAFTGLLFWAKLFSVVRRLRSVLACRESLPQSSLPQTAAAVVAGYLPSDGEALVRTAAAFLDVEYPGHLQVVLAYATEGNAPLPGVEARLLAIAQQQPERFQLFRLLNAPDQDSCLAAAQKLATGDLVAVFRPGQIPTRDCMQHAQRLAASLPSSTEDLDLPASMEAEVRSSESREPTAACGAAPSMDAIVQLVGTVFGGEAACTTRWSDFGKLLSSSLSLGERAALGCDLTWAKVLPVALTQALPLLAFLCYYKNGGLGSPSSGLAGESLGAGPALLLIPSSQL